MFFVLIHHTAWIAAGLALGTCVGFYSSYFFIGIFCLPSIVSFVIAWRLHNMWLLRSSLLITCVLCGAWYTQRVRTANRDQQIFYARHTLDIIAYVDDITKTKNNRYMCGLNVRALRFNAQQPWLPTNDRIMLCTPPANMATGDKIFVETLICQPFNADDPPRNCLTACSFFAKNISIVSHPHWSLQRFIITQRNSFWQSLEKKLSPQTFRLMSIIFFGKSINDEIQQALRTDFVQWGVAHYLARSGIHLILILILINTLLSLFLLSITARTIIATLIGAVYFCFSWVSIPFARACMALGSYYICHLLKIPINSLHILHLTLIISLITDPLAIACLDFQLTFALTYALIIILRHRLIA